MTRFVVLFRGVNVGGHRKLPMAGLRQALEAAGFGQVESHIQSGNVVLTSRAGARQVEAEIAALVRQTFGFDAPVLALPADEFRAVVEAAPFEPGTEPSHAHIFFDMVPGARVRVDDLRPEPGDASVMTNAAGAVYLATPEGLSASRLAEALGRRLKDKTTARNLRTCLKLLEMVDHATA